MSAIEASRTVSRFLGGSKARGAPLASLNSAVAKSEGKSVSAAAAHIARATALLNRPLALDSLNSVLEDVSAAVEALKTAPANSKEAKLLHRLALALRLRALNNLLDEKEHTMLISGATNEVEVSNARTHVRDAYEALLKVTPNDPFVLLGYAEFQLYQGEAEAALATATKAEELFNEEAARLTKVANETVASPENSTPASIVAFKVTTSLPAVDVSAVKSPIVKDTLSVLSERPNVTEEELNALRQQLDAPASLTNDELLCLASAVDNAEKGQNFLEFFPLTETYQNWSSEASLDVAHAVESFMYGKGVTLSSEELAPLAKKPASTFYASTTELKKIIEGKSNSDFLDEVVAKFGEGPKSSLAATDNAFWGVVGRLSGEGHCNFSGGSFPSIQRHFKLATQLIDQLQYRVAVAKALAEDQLKNSRKALELLDSVVDANEFVYMWKVFLARGRVRQGLGMVNEADADFKTLFKLRKAYAGADIPLRDENRTKSVF